MNKMMLGKKSASAVLMTGLALALICTEGGAAVNPHASLSWQGRGTCLACHEKEAQEMFGSVHYQWQGAAPAMSTGAARQGKMVGAVNAYCGNITGNWNGCGVCHVGGGAPPEEQVSQAQLENIDCLLCHQKEYKRVRGADGLFVPDEKNMVISMDTAVRTLHRPQRDNCLQCHAKGGGGDAYKRGDLALAHAATNDRSFDVHMAKTGAKLACQSCHDFTGHRVMGQGADLYPTDKAGRVSCSTSACHVTIHGSGDISRHLARVACQTCHIGTYARNASDTVATEATETHRSWATGHLLPTGVFHPEGRFANNLTPEYRFWNGSAQGYSLYDQATFDPERGTYPITRPLGAIDDAESKLFPFKYKTAEQPYIPRSNQLLALNTSIFFVQGQLDPAVRSGLVNMGFPENEPYTMVLTDTFQTLNHEVMPRNQALSCTDCHGSATRMDLKAMGYALKNTMSKVCSQCHSFKSKSTPDFFRIHTKHVSTEKLDCSSCHTFSRPERNLRTGIVRH